MIMRRIIASILMVALTLVSFGHQSLSPGAEAQAESYILAGGDWADLCGDEGDPLAHVTKCMACLISQACAVPAPGDIAHPATTYTALTWAITPENTAIASWYSSQTARAPPFRLV